MDQIPTQKTPNQTKPNTKTKTNPFLGCLRFSRKTRNKNFPEKIEADDHNHKKFLCLIPWSRGCLKKSSSNRTVPVDADTVSQISNPDKKINQLAKTESKSDQIELVLPVVPDHTLQAKPQETSYDLAQDTNLGSRKELNHSRTPKPNKCQNIQSFSRKIEVIRNGSTQPGSPKAGTAKRKPNKIHSMTRQFSAIALPAEVKDQRVGLKSEGRLDPIVGMSVIMVTLIIMLLWGRLCAILCTSAWFYFIPMLKNAIGSDIGIDSNSKTLDMNSEEYKKRVVLEGFLRRN